MIVEEITSVGQFDGLKEVWDKLFIGDARASVFMSWAFLKGRFEVSDEPHWILLGARKNPSSEYVGFLPLGRRSFNKYGVPVVREIGMGGSPWADYTGFLCQPDHAQEVIAAMGRHVRDRMVWDRLVMRDVVDPRLDQFLDVFRPFSDFSVETSDDNICPFLTLPSCWDDYCREFFNKKKRYNLLRSIGMVEGLKGFSVTNSTSEDIGKHLDAHFLLYGQRWGHNRSRASLVKPIFLRSAQAGHFWAKTVWSEGVPVATAVGFVDRKAGSCMLYGTTFNATFASLSPGRVVVALSIRDAISQGLNVFDFLRGDEEYKFGLGASSRKSKKATVCRRDLRSRLGTRLLNIPSLRRWMLAHCTRPSHPAPGKAKG